MAECFKMVIILTSNCYFKNCYVILKLYLTQKLKLLFPASSFKVYTLELDKFIQSKLKILYFPVSFFFLI